MESKILEILKSLQDGQKRMETRLDSMESQINENTQLLKALEHKVDVIKAEQENIKHDIAHIKGDVEAVKKDITNVEVITASNWADIAKLKAVK
nr:hypothetical protein [uncultured Romboutsia sp.]